MKNYGNFIKENLWGSGENKDFNGEYIPIKKDNYKYIGFNELDFEEIYDQTEEIEKSEIEKYVSLDTIKKMFPIYNSIKFIDDWSIHIYKYENYIIIYKSGYYYTFEKNNY